MYHNSSVLDDWKTVYCFVLSSPPILFLLVDYLGIYSLGEEDVQEMEVTVSNELTQVQQGIETHESVADENDNEVINCGIFISSDSQLDVFFPNKTCKENFE